jgi:hypothetical protein
MSLPIISNKTYSVIRPAKTRLILPVVLRLFLGGVAMVGLAGCKSAKTHQETIAQQRAAEAERFFRDHLLCYSSKTQEGYYTDKVDPALFPGSYKQDLFKNGWDLALLRLIQKEVDQAKVPFLLPKVCFAVSNGCDYTASVQHKEKGNLASTLIVVNLSTDISEVEDKESLVKMIAQHELNHARDHAFFRLRTKKNGSIENTITDFFINQAVKLLRTRGQRASQTSFKTQLETLASRVNDYPGNKKPLSFYFTEIRAEEKVNPFGALAFYNYIRHSKYPRQEKADKLTPIEMAFDLTIVEKLGADAKAAEIKEEVAKLSRSDQELFSQCHDYFDLHYEVSKREIDYATLPTVKLPPLINF